MMFDPNKCYICKFDATTGRAIGRQANKSLHWHLGDDGIPWVFCVGSCQRAYSIWEYTAKTGFTIADVQNSKIAFEEAAPNTVNKMEWPRQFIPLFDKRAAQGVEYIKKRKINPSGEMFYDFIQNGIVFPYYFDTSFCGAQIRFIEPKDSSNKITTIPGTRLSLLFYNYNQMPLPLSTKAVIVTEGSFDALSIQQSLDTMYPEFKNPFKVVALSGASISEHHREVLRDLKLSGLKIIAATDNDDAGFNACKKLIESSSISHYAVTGDEKVDWNSALVDFNGNHEEYGKWFLSKVVKL